MGITVGCMTSSMHVLPIGSEAVSSGPSQWTMTGSVDDGSVDDDPFDHGSVDADLGVSG